MKVKKVIHYYLQKTMDIAKYFCPSEGGRLDESALNSKMPGALHASVLSAAREMNKLEEREKIKKKIQVLPENN